MIILLGGAPGTGKTTVGNLLVERLGLAHHLSTGFIRSAISHLLPEEQNRLLRLNSYDAYLETRNTGNVEDYVLHGAVQQALLIRPSVEACIKRGIREGIDMVLEGTHCIPGVINPAAVGATILCLLDVPNREMFRNRIVGSNHSKRVVSKQQLEDLVHMQDQFKKLAIDNHSPVIVNEDLEEAVQAICELVAD